MTKVIAVLFWLLFWGLSHWSITSTSQRLKRAQQPPRRENSDMLHTQTTQQALWKVLQPIAIENCHMRRYGRSYDGGYVLCGNLLRAVNSVYSYGIDGRDSWGCDVSRRHHLSVHQYDCFNTERVHCEGGKLVFHQECIGPAAKVEDGR